jgi:CD2 antigen cytoplasmic tail-binding protein 2
MSSSKHPLATAGLDAPPSKKPRFSVRNPSALITDDAADEDEDNAELAADVIGSNRPNARRGAVNIDGFDSDSDGGGNFDERAADKARASKKAQKSRDEEDADMFADLEEDFKDGDVSDTETGKKKKDVRFLNEDQIEGQVKNSRAGGHVSSRLKLTDQEASYLAKHGRLPASANIEDAASESSDSEADDETRAALDEEIDEELGAGAKVRHAPKLDAFNMRDEQDEGRFDESGNFVRKAVDPDAVHDRWLEGTSKKDMKKAKDAMEKREEERRRREREDDARSTAHALKDLIVKMEGGETVLEALARLGKTKGKKGGPKKSDEAETKRKESVEAITSAADLLLTRGRTEIYDAERELLIRQWSRETGEQWKDEDTQEKMWEYRWTDARDGGNINGPYNALTMRQWNEAGYFGEGVEFRPAGDDTWSRVADFL